MTFHARAVLVNPALIKLVTALTLLLAATAATAETQADCSALKGCEQKFCQMETQISMAKQGSDAGQVAGLQHALDNAKTFCSDTQMQDDLTEKLAKANQRLQQYQVDLKQAQQNAEAGKIVKYQKKLQETASEIKRLKDLLSQLEQLPPQ